jgi:hypothetical protein
MTVYETGVDIADEGTLLFRLFAQEADAIAYAKELEDQYPTGDIYTVYTVEWEVS